MTRIPSFFELDEAECREILGQRRVGRIAFMAGPRVDIQPLGYVLRGDWLFMRSAYGSRLEALERNPYVAFAVDEIRGPFDWESVVVHGTIYLLEPTANQADRTTYADAVDALRSAMPDAFTPDDPVPHRSTVYGLRIDTLKGRSAGRGGADRTPLTPSTRPRPDRPHGT